MPDYIPEEADIAMLRVQYNLPARKNDNIVVKTAKDKNAYYVLLENEQGELFVSLEFTERI